MRSRRARVCHLLTQEAPSSLPEELQPEPWRETDADPLPLLPGDAQIVSRTAPSVAAPAARVPRQPAPQESPPLTEAPHGVRRVFRPSLLLPLALAASLAFAAPRLAHFLPDLEVRDEYRLRTELIVVSDLPRWVPPDLVAQVVQQAELPAECSLLEPELAVDVARAFARHPWVAEVVQVRKSYPPRLEVELRYRKPVALVEVKQGLYPVDIEGTLLPPADFAASDLSRFPVISNIATAPQGPAGTPWGDPTVAAAARLAEALAPRWKEFGLKSIHVPRRTTAELELEGLSLMLVSSGGSVVLWGRPPGTTHPGELSVPQKIGRVAQYISTYGSLDQAHGPYEIDIRHWHEISRRPLPSSIPVTASPAVRRHR